MADAVAIRACRHADVEKFASQCGKPVINALTEEQHPCQILADIMTFEERKGDIRGKRIAVDRRRQQCLPHFTRRGADF